MSIKFLVWGGGGGIWFFWGGGGSADFIFMGAGIFLTTNMTVGFLAWQGPLSEGRACLGEGRLGVPGQVWEFGSLLSFPLFPRWATPPVRLGLSEEIPEKFRNFFRKRSQSIS